MRISDYHRIVIVGNNGSGKSFLAKELSAITGLPLIHLDVAFWRPNWEQPTKEEWMRQQMDFVAGPEWIIDGMHRSTMELRFQAADLVIFLDINRLVCLMSIFKRTGKKRSDMPQYLEEKFDAEFFQFCKRMWQFPQAGKRTILDLHAKYSDKPFMAIKGRRNLRKMLVQWQKEKSRRDLMFDQKLQ